MTDLDRIWVGLAGWSNPPGKRAHRDADESHLSYYARHYSCVEINSSFYRSHRAATYARWRDATPETFRFSLKMPKSITHDSHLKRCAGEVERFYDDIVHLQPKLAVVLIQLPPTLEFDSRSVRAFFKRAPRLPETAIVCEPRQSSWFTKAADNVLKEARVSRVAADPARYAGAELPAGLRRFAYFRWHGSPHLYYSHYSEAQIDRFAATVRRCSAREAWCVFDNTARYAAWDDASRFATALRRI
jgi:uncharacterized protein YecE (DUF72 family)